MTVADFIAEHVGKALEEEKKEMEVKVEEEKQKMAEAQRYKLYIHKCNL